ncbi:MAG: alpha/beta fold hydrolase, partial [Actinobacteria bacterium]|nr:alpha/beta fold hydrolase [Actinomycetota bacterium]
MTLVHGFTQTRRCWGPVADDLAADHEVVAVDAPGHGRSAQVRAGLWEGARLLAGAGGDATYLGYSMGGRLCLHLALAAPERVRALVVVGATAGIDDPAQRAARRAEDEERARRLEAEGLEPFLERWLAQPLFAGLAEEVQCREERRENTVAGLAASLRLAGAGAQEPLWHRLEELAMPVLVIAGEHD